MIKLGIRKVKPGEEEHLRNWMSQLESRRPEVLATFEQEGMRHEQVFLLNVAEGPILIYAMEAEDHSRASAAFAQSPLPIDIEHKRVMTQVLGGPVQYELLFECHA